MKILIVGSLSALLVLAGCSSSGSPGAATTSTSPAPRTLAPSSSVAGTTRAVIAACRAASPAVVTEVSSGLIAPATTLLGAMTVDTTPSERSSGSHYSVILAARINGAGSAIGLWADGGGGADGLNSVAHKYSYWGTATQPGSPAAAERAAMQKWPETAKAKACLSRSSSHSTTPRDPKSCNLTAPDVIYWFISPGQPAVAQLLGGVNLARCTYTASQSEVDKGSPQGPGFCTIVASVDANPGYNVDATPAPKPAGILAESGGGC